MIKSYTSVSSIMPLLPGWQGKRRVPRYTALNQPRPQNTVRNHSVYVGLENVVKPP